MSQDFSGIYQTELFKQGSIINMDLYLEDQHSIFARKLPWQEMAEIATIFRSKKINVNLGAILDLRLHLGAMIMQSMNGWTDRMTEDMVRYHLGVRIICGIGDSTKTIDHTSIETFRNSIGEEGMRAINEVIVKRALKMGFTTHRLAAADTTVQEAPIAHPTEVGHMKNIAEKLLGIGSSIHKGILGKLKKLRKEALDIFTEIRLYTRGKKEEAINKKKELGKRLHKVVSKMADVVSKKVSKMSHTAQKKYHKHIDFYKEMLSQIKKWQDTGFHPKEKIISLWHRTARAISRGKSKNEIEFGISWIITRMSRGYVIGKASPKVSGGIDTVVVPEVLDQMQNLTGKTPQRFVYDRGGDSKENHQALEERGVKENAIYRKSSQKKYGKVFQKNSRSIAKARSLTEASIGVLKSRKYNFTNPRAKTVESCKTKGHVAMLGANLNRLMTDLQNPKGMSVWSH